MPTLKESGVDVAVMPGWYALVAPKNLDPKIAGRVATAVQHVLSEPAVKSKLAEMSLEPIPGTGADIKKRAEADSRVWGDFIRQNAIQAE